MLLSSQWRQPGRELGQYGSKTASAGKCRGQRSAEAHTRQTLSQQQPLTATASRTRYLSLPHGSWQEALLEV